MDSHTIVRSPAFYYAFIRHLNNLQKDFIRQGRVDKASETLYLIQEMKQLLEALPERPLAQ